MADYYLTLRFSAQPGQICWLCIVGCGWLWKAILDCCWLQPRLLLSTLHKTHAFIVNHCATGDT